MARPATVLGILVRPFASLMTASKLVGTILSRRLVMGQLGQMDDRMLKDIGLTRHDVWSAMAEPLFRDPTVGLVARARESRLATKANLREKLAHARLVETWERENRAA
ncbi:DUF1127 domain-containing protein [Lichenifustis flavocetrariae]|uniref:DUF1127 domain-containing protein n=1 Tax=Lichenifustis flavocetrariae TaxID=2949735 RepID=A0AA41YYE5_9HYPH|nr:DUF1127 domain-containing protein [Lichenifustis flavocetrariae]MCW6509502.1 DUF1127 domain-containing protein [Lichenifustis flavocetrariae]